VIGVPNDEFGEEVKAVVIVRNGYQAGDDLEAELIAFCRQSLAGYKIPRSVDFVTELPRNDTGKMYKRLLRDQYWAGRESKLV
jgi:acyl-coenzyme A synthetase/AMP-(fatty) acid ligase